MAEELFTRKQSVKDVLNIIEEKLRRGLFKETIVDFDRIMSMDFNYPKLYDNIACVKFWINRYSKIESLESDLSRLGIFLDDTYKKFLEFLRAKSFGHDLIVVVAIHNYVYNKIIACITDKNIDDIESKEDLSLLAKAFIELKDYERGIKAYEYLRTIEPYNGHTLACLAQIYHILGDERKAKMCIRDALFYGPLDIPLEDITINIVHELKDVIIKRGAHNKSEEEILLWMSAYGELMNILDIKRPFHDGEEVYIRKVISSLEADYRKVKFRASAAPKLLSAYAFLTTSLIASRNEEDIEEITILGRKMALIDKELVQCYIKLLNIKKR